MWLALVLAALPAVADPARPTEYEVKAAFLYNFAKFVAWPPAAQPASDRPFVVAVLGRDPFGPVLDQVLAGKSLSGHAVEVRRVHRLEDARDAHLLFISDSERHRLEYILKMLRGRPVLTVGDMEGFAAKGGIINFRLDERRVRFEINARRASQEHLRVSSQLLKLATIVEK